MSSRQVTRSGKCDSSEAEKLGIPLLLPDSRTLRLLNRVLDMVSSLDFNHFRGPNLHNILFSCLVLLCWSPLVSAYIRTFSLCLRTMYLGLGGSLLNSYTRLYLKSLWSSIRWWFSLHCASRARPPAVWEMVWKQLKTVRFTKVFMNLSHLSQHSKQSDWTSPAAKWLNNLVLIVSKNRIYAVLVAL